MSDKKTVLKPLKKLTFARTLCTWVLGWLVLAFVFFAFTGFAPQKGFNGPTKIGDIAREDLKGEYVLIDDYYVLGETYETWDEYDDGHTSNHKYYFLIWVYTEDEDSGFYTHIRVNSTERKTLNELSEKQSEYFDKLEAGEDALWPYCPDYKGCMEHLDYEISSFTKEILSDIDEQEYYIDQPSVELFINPEICSGLLDEEGVVAFTYLGAVSIALAVITFLRAAFGSKMGKVKKFVNATFDGDWREAAADFESAEKFGSCYITGKCIYYMTTNRAKVFAAKLEDAVWAYKHTTITNGVAHNCMMIRMEEKPKKAVGIRITKETAIRNALEKLLREQGHIVIGYSARLENMLYKDMNEFKAFAAKQRAPGVKETPAVQQPEKTVASEEDGE